MNRHLSLHQEPFMFFRHLADLTCCWRCTALGLDHMHGVLDWPIARQAICHALARCDFLEASAAIPQKSCAKSVKSRIMCLEKRGQESSEGNVNFQLQNSHVAQGKDYQVEAASPRLPEWDHIKRNVVCLYLQGTLSRRFSSSQSTMAQPKGRHCKDHMPVDWKVMAQFSRKHGNDSLSILEALAHKLSLRRALPLVDLMHSSNSCLRLKHSSGASLPPGAWSRSFNKTVVM